MIDVTNALVPLLDNVGSSIKGIRLIDAGEHIDTRARFTLQVEVEGYPTLYMAIPGFYLTIFEEGDQDSIDAICKILAERLVRFLGTRNH